MSTETATFWIKVVAALMSLAIVIGSGVAVTVLNMNASMAAFKVQITDLRRQMDTLSADTKFRYDAHMASNDWTRQHDRDVTQDTAWLRMQDRVDAMARVQGAHGEDIALIKQKINMKKQ